MEEGIIKAAQEFTGLDEKPSKFDYERELIRVHFDRPLEYSVLVHPITFEIHGFRNDNLIQREGEPLLDADARKAKADEIFSKLPENYKKELVYDGESELYLGTFEHKWFRQVNGIYIASEQFEVEVDPISAEVIAWRQLLFFYEKELMNFNPAFDHDIAQEIAVQRFDGTAVEGEQPVLVIDQDKPQWIAKVKVLYPIFITIDALTGEVLYSGGLRYDIPTDYDAGRDVPVVETDFIKQFTGGAQ